MFGVSEYKATLKAHAILPVYSLIAVPDDAPNLLRSNGKFALDKRVDDFGMIDGFSNGRPTRVFYPFAGQPVQGHSGVVYLGDDRYAFLTVNGLGDKANSKDSALFYNIYKIDFESGKFLREKTVFLKDPNKKVPFSIVNESTKKDI